jgi:hypothetical protein
MPRANARSSQNRMRHTTGCRNADDDRGQVFGVLEIRLRSWMGVLVRLASRKRGLERLQVVVGTEERQSS